MNKVIIADASPLIALASIDRLELLRFLYQEVVIPVAVERELCIDSDRPGATALRCAMEQGWITVQACIAKDKTRNQLLQLLDPGEVEAILLTEQLSYRFLLIDERKGRDIALKRNIIIAGTGAVLLAAKNNGLIESVKNELEKLQAIGYRFSSQLVARLIKLAGEP